MQRQPNPLFQNVVREMTDTTNQLNNLQAKTIHAQRDLEEARRDLAKETTDRDALKAELDRLHENLTKAQGYSDVAKDGLEGAQATLQNLIPGVPFQCSP
jgi:chromosome segregation ATPase